MMIDIIQAIAILVIGFFVYRIYSIFKGLSKNIEVDISKKHFSEIEKRLSELEEDGRHHIQKVGLVRFNPFKELGGDHSFSLSVLDNEESGIILTSLHTRDRTRVYMKEIKNGKSDYQLSDEEKKSLGIAKRK